MPTSPDFDYENALAACAKRDGQALHRLYQQEASRLLGVAHRIVRDRQIAEDIVHDSFISIWNQAGSFDPSRGSARGWIYSITRHKALNLVRDELRCVSADEEMLEALDAETTLAVFEDAFAIKADLGKLDECLGRLDTAKRNSILYAYVDGCSHGEIAERLKSPLGSVKAWIRRGLSSLRECMS